MFLPSSQFVTSCARLHQGIQTIGSFFSELSDHTSDPELQKLLRAEAAERTSQSARLRRLFAVLGRPPEHARCPLLHSLMENARKRLATAKREPHDKTVTEIASQLGSYELAAHELLNAEASSVAPAASLLKVSLQKANSSSLKWRDFLQHRARKERSVA